MSLKLPTASSTQPGIIDTGTQTIAGDKTISGKVTMNYGLESTGQLRTTTFFNVAGSGGTSAFSVNANSSGLLFIVNGNTGEGALILFAPTNVASIVSQVNGTSWSIGTGAGSDNRFAYTSSTGVMTITKNDAGTNSYQAFILYCV